MHFRFIALLVFIWFVGLSSCSGNSPSKPVEDFYNLYLNIHPVGLLNHEEEKVLAPYLSKHLLALIDEARLYQEAFIRQHPNDKPPWVDGCLFASLFEGPSWFKISDVIANPDGTSTVKVHFGYESSEWEDSVIVRVEAGRFVIDDILMSGAGDFNPPGRLSEHLRYRFEPSP
jgi:hypothetical protein